MEERGLLEVRAVRPSGDKVDRVEFHPTQPWLALVSRGNAVTVWNYESNEVRPWGAQRSAAPSQAGGRQGVRCGLQQ